MKKNPMNIIWMLLGFLCLAFGTIGIVLPILPTVPLYMATVFCFAKSSVSVNRSLQKTSGQLCAGKSHDAWNKTENYRNGDRCDGDRFSLHEKYADRKNLYHSGVGMPYFIFFPACKNSGLKTEIFIDKKAKKYYY